MLFLQVFAGDDGKSRIFRCTMTHNRKHCAAIYWEDEYEKLVLEAYSQARAKTKMANNRYPFTCIHCKESHKDKNAVSYHRMFNLCKVYKGEDSLKMYPTWEPSQSEEKSRIIAKFKKVASPTTSQDPSLEILSLPLDLDTPPITKRALSMVSTKHDLPSKKCKLTLKTSPHSLPERKRSLCVTVPSNVSPLSSPPKVRKLAMNASPEFPMSPLSTKRKVKHEHIPHSHQPQPLSRNELEEQAHRKATTLFYADIEMVSPPPPIAVHGLYILITETSGKWVPKELIEDPNACMQYLHKQLEDGTLFRNIGSAFGEWYLSDDKVFSSSFAFCIFQFSC